MDTKVLFIPSSGENIQEDVVYEGLCELLGPENVVDYPEKEMYHQIIPCRGLDYPSHHANRDSVLSTQFDAVVLGSIRPTTLDPWGKIASHFRKTPIAWLHGEDSDHPLLDEWPVYKGWPNHVYHTHRFYREYTEDYKDNLNDITPVFPLPFAAMKRVFEMYGNKQRYNRDTDVSFVASYGHKSYKELRQAYADMVQTMGWYNATGIPFFEYSHKLKRSKVSISVRGAGWDTLRFWEIPQHGALLASQRIPITISHPFEDGKTAIFADTPEEMAEKIKTALNSNWNEIRLAGMDHLEKYHTSVDRARYVLETILE